MQILALPATTVLFATMLSSGHARAAEPSIAEPLPAEAIGTIETLPEQYPAHWILALDSSFFHMLEGQVVVIDPLAETAAEQHKGMFTASFMAAIDFSRERSEFYVAESFFARGGRGGERTDVVAIYDPATLSISAEVEIPPKRLGGMPKRIATGVTDDDSFLLVYNFTPAQSVSVIDLEKREFVGEIDTPGCSFVVPTGKRGFSSLCANGAFYTVELDADGSAGETHRTKSVIDVADDPVFEAYGRVGNTGYFPTFTGNVLPVRLNGRAARPERTWSLVDADEREAGWRPGGVLPIVNDYSGALYVLMHPDGADGTHKNGGSEVWVFDPDRKRRTRRIELQNWGLSLGMTGNKRRTLMTVVNADLGVDVYDAASGELLNSVAVAMDTPFRIEGAR